MNWYNTTTKLAFPGSALPKSNKWKEIEDNREAIQDMINDGHPLREIAPLFDVGVPLFSKMMATFGIKRDKEITKQKAKEMLDNGEPLTNVSKKLKVDPKTIKKWFEIETRKIKHTPNVPVTPEEGKEIIRLHVEEGLRPTEIIKQVNRSLSTVKTYLEKAGIYQRLRGDWIRFNPSPEQIQKIDYWYTLPPKGEGRSLYWIATQFGILSSQLGQWFKQTGRETRPQTEQAKTEFSRGEQSANKLLEWEEKGYLDGYLKSLSYDRALWYLNKYVGRIYDNNPQKASAVRVKYTRIIEDHFAQQSQPMQPTIAYTLNWYKIIQSDWKENLGECYILSGRYVMSHSDSILIHGSVNGNNHAWVEMTKNIPDNTTGNEYTMDIVFDPVMGKEYLKEYYYKQLNAIVTKQYSSEEVIKTMVRYNHWGPWDEANPPKQRINYS